MGEGANIKAPDGITDRHAACSPLQQAAGPLGSLLLVLLLVLVVGGYFGGYPRPVLRSETSGATLSVKSPAVIRTGEFYETEIVATPKRPVKELVIAISPSLWRDITQNTMVPAASDESFEDGMFRFSYGPWEAGKPIELKIALQINPTQNGTVTGDVVVLDGDTPLAATPVTMKIRA